MDASSGSSSFRLALADNLLEGLQLRPVGDYQLAWLNGSVGPTNQVIILHLGPIRALKPMIQFFNPIAGDSSLIGYELHAQNLL